MFATWFFEGFISNPCHTAHRSSKPPVSVTCTALDMLHSLVSAQPPGHVVHICTQAEFDALLTSTNASESTSTLDDTTTIQLPEPKAGPQQEFISGSEKDFQIMGMTKTPYHFLHGLLGQTQSACHSWVSDFGWSC
jgi:hypothetical protein